MKVRVDQAKCETAGICVEKCPQIFAFQPGSKKAYVKVDTVPPELEKKCMKVVLECPAQAISVVK